jgi:amino acid transporter
MAKRRRRVVVKKSRFHKYTLGTVWFLAILLLAIFGASPAVFNRDLLWLLLAICGAIVAIYNIQKKEEISFLITSSTLLIIVIFMQVSGFSVTSMVDNFIFNLGVAFGAAAFVVALALVAKLGLEK